MKVIPAVVLMLLATPTAAFAAGALPDGKYQCVMDDTLPNGEMIIAGDTYQGPDYDGKYEGKFTFSVVSDNITWHGPLGIYREGFDIIGSMVVSGDNNQPAIAINFKEAGGDVVHTTYCDLE